MPGITWFTRCNMTADWAPKLDESTCVPGKCSNAWATRCCADKDSNDRLTATTASRSLTSWSVPNQRTSEALKPTFCLSQDKKHSSPAVFHPERSNSNEPCLFGYKAVRNGTAQAGDLRVQQLAGQTGIDSSIHSG